MHRKEGHPKDMMTKSLSMWKTVKGHTYQGVTLAKSIICGMQESLLYLPTNWQKPFI